MRCDGVILLLVQASIQNRVLGAPMGRTLMGSNVLLVGFGNIARELAIRLKPFGVSLAAVRRQEWTSEPLPDLEVQAFDGGGDLHAAADACLDHRGGPADMLRFAAKADIVVVLCNLSSENHGMVQSAIPHPLNRCLPDQACFSC